MTTKPVKVGFIGCGQISSIYLKNCQSFGILEVVACADLDLERARKQAEAYQVSIACSVDELLANPEIEMIVNLTIPGAHAEISRRALEAGKHVYVEKPFAVETSDGMALLALAKEKGLRIGSAPETFMGGGIQTCRKLIDDNWIGKPLSANGFMMSRGMEHTHLNPAFFYQVGGGPMFDMGPYYLTALITLLGPIQEITAMAKISFPERVIGSEPKRGEKIPVEVPTHVAGLARFHNDVIATLIMSFDVMGGTQLPRIEIHGTTGSLSVPDPNKFGNPIYYRASGELEWKEIPFTHGYTENTRGIGAADMAYAIRYDRKHRASGEMAQHVLEAMHAFYAASDSGTHQTLQSTCERPAPMPMRLLPFTLDTKGEEV